jgi:transcriptional regulator PpsR
MSLTTREHSVGKFDNPELYLANLEPDLVATLVTAAADVILILDDTGTIRDMAFASEELLDHGFVEWLNKPWAQTVTVESKPKVEALLREQPGLGKPPKWRHLNLPWSGGVDLPLSCAVMPIGRRSSSGQGNIGHTIVFGRDLRPQVALQQRLVAAQLSMEQDYWRLRHVEARYRLLFQVTSEPLLIMDAATEKLEEGNPAAYRLLGDKIGAAGWALSHSFVAQSVADLQQAFNALRVNGKASSIKVKLFDSDELHAVHISLFRQESSNHFLIRFAPLLEQEISDSGQAKRALAQLMESAPDAFVVTDLSGVVLTANQSFLQLAQLTNENVVVGESLEKWLGRPGVDLNVLLSNLKQRGSVRLFSTRIKGEYGSIAEVEISAVAVVSGEQQCMGFTIRDIGRRLASDLPMAKEIQRSPSQMTELVGRVPLREIVRETTDLIEQLCIEAALELTGDNRASAAEMLGLSRQSLYVKLRRFGIGESASPEGTEE